LTLKDALPKDALPKDALPLQDAASGAPAPGGIVRG
jgi:hypothetical protein